MQMPNQINVGFTSAISIRMPFSLPLKVGGNNECIAKWITSSPVVVEPFGGVESTVTTNLFSVDPGVVLGVNVVFICFQVLCDPEMANVRESSTVPAESWSASVSFPLKLDGAEAIR